MDKIYALDEIQAIINPILQNYGVYLIWELYIMNERML